MADKEAAREHYRQFYDDVPRAKFDRAFDAYWKRMGGKADAVSFQHHMAANVYHLRGYDPSWPRRRGVMAKASKGDFPHLEKRAWKRAENYMGEDLSNYYVLIGRHRDSTLLDESNWEVAKEKFGGKPGVREASFSHWAVGWGESLLVSKDAPEDVLEAAEEMLDGLENYPVLDEEDYSSREYKASIKNIQSIGENLKRSEAEKVYTWLSENMDNELESVDDQGAWPSDESVKKALSEIRSGKRKGGVRPRIGRKIRRRRGRGPGKGWHKQPRRHARAARKGHARRRRR